MTPSERPRSPAPSRPVPFHRPTRVGREIEYLAQAFADDRLAGDGPFTARCERLLEECVEVPRALLTTSCTHALEMAALLLDVGPGDEVVLPSFTFPSTANAFVLRGARPVFVDVRPDTLNLDETLLADRLGPRTRAVVVVHYAGVAAALDAITALAAERGVPVVEDNAHGLFGRFRGRPLGSFGALATLSFHATKNLTCGEGGALLVNDPELCARAEIVREKGTDRSRFVRGEVARYSWVDVGSSYLPSELLAAVLLAQLESRDEVQAARRRVWERYLAGLADWAPANGVGLPRVPPECEPAYHLFYLLMPSAADRQRLIEHLRRRGVHATFHFQPLHLARMGRRFGGRPGELPVTESVSERLVRLPFFTALGDAEVDRVVAAVRDFSA